MSFPIAEPSCLTSFLTSFPYQAISDHTQRKPPSYAKSPIVALPDSDPDSTFYSSLSRPSVLDSTPRLSSRDSFSSPVSISRLYPDQIAVTIHDSPPPQEVSLSSPSPSSSFLSVPDSSLYHIPVCDSPEPPITQTTCVALFADPSIPTILVHPPPNPDHPNCRDSPPADLQSEMDQLFTSLSKPIARRTLFQRFESI